MTANPTPTRGAVSESADGTIRLSSLTKTYDDGNITAVNGIDLEVRDGEVLVLLGPSGCGKTTTLRMIAGLEMPTDGTITIGEEDVTHLHPRQRDLSLVFQSYALYPHKTVYENLEFPLDKMDLTATEKEEKITFAAELLEIDGILEKKPGQLSGGQRQRVAVGRTIVREPRVFLMDEPLSNLDAKLRVKARAEIRQLQQQLETTMVYVTHDQEEAMSIADRIAVMNDGQIEQVGTPADVYNDPSTEFIAEFIGEPGMNFFDAKLGDGDLGVQFGDDPIDVGLDVDGSVRRVGVRPEEVYVAGESTKGTGEPIADLLPSEFDCRVILREPLGHASELTLERDGETMTAWIRDCPESVAEDETITIGFDRETMHAFDEAGERVR